MGDRLGIPGAVDFCLDLSSNADIVHHLQSVSSSVSLFCLLLNGPIPLAFVFLHAQNVDIRAVSSRMAAQEVARLRNTCSTITRRIQIDELSESLIAT